MTKKTENIEMTEERLNELKTVANSILATCRQNMLNKHVFVGSVAMNLGLIPTRDRRINTACTEGANIYFDIDFLSKLTDDERTFVVAHEVWHNVMLHFNRRQNRDAQLFNIATDMEVNQILKEDGFTAPKGLMWPSMAPYYFKEGLNAEQYYDLLVDYYKKHQNEQPEEGSSDKSLAGQFDRHIDSNNISDFENEAEADVEATDKYGKVGIDDDVHPSSDKRQVEKMREAVVSAAQQTERAKGELPSYIQRIVHDLLEPEIDWKEQLAFHVSSSVQNKITWNRPNRRYAYSGTYLPSHEGEALRIAVGIDTSGSVDQNLEQFLTELSGIARSFGDYEITVIQCDTEVKKVESFDESNPIDFNSKPFEVKGFGGTHLHPIFSYIEDKELDVDQIVMFTDGYCEEFKAEEAPNVPVLWVLTNDGNTKDIHFGEKIKFKK